jgi:hypothetical protein
MTSEAADAGGQERDRLDRLNRLIHAAGFDASFAVLEDLPDGEDGWTGWVARHPYACIARRLTEAAAQAKLLHEVAHWTLGHEFDYAYRAAASPDMGAAGRSASGPWEIEADALAVALVDDLSLLTADPAASLQALFDDAARFS